MRALVLRTFSHARWTQDSPVVPDVWLAYMRAADARAHASLLRSEETGPADDGGVPPSAKFDPTTVQPLLVTAWDGASAGRVAAWIRGRLIGSSSLGADANEAVVAARIAMTTTRVAVDLDLRGLVRAVVPLTGWWESFTDKFVPARALQAVLPRPGKPDFDDMVGADAEIDHDAAWEQGRGQATADDDVFWIPAGAFSPRSPDPSAPRTPSPTPSSAEEEARREDVRLSDFFDLLFPPAGEKNRLRDGLAVQMREFLRYVVLVGFVRRLESCETSSEYERLRVDAKRLSEFSDREGDPGDVAAAKKTDARDAFRAFADAYVDAVGGGSPPARCGVRRERRVWMINPNRPAHRTLWDSRKTTKADASERLFQVTGRGIVFAVIDDGVDASHLGFMRRSEKNRDRDFSALEPLERLPDSRVRRTWDFTQLRLLVGEAARDPKFEVEQLRTAAGGWDNELWGTFVTKLNNRRAVSQNLDWELIEPALRLEGERWIPPTSHHGTHVAGILGAWLPPNETIERPLVGMCPDIEIWDLRVFDPETGGSDEFTITAALDFVRWINRARNRPTIHGVNLSLALIHEVTSFGCGQTPICESCNRLVAEGTVVVAAAGNAGWDQEAVGAGLGHGYGMISITDPGNADAVITVGSTHRSDPHAYGVSYFSSRGPTGDGRRKPDLLAPGEKITSLFPGDRIDRLDGTSMAAPHVAGAAALLMQRYPELVGRPQEIKRILMSTATDLGREAMFQGAGLLDVLRALQAV
ncbi:MAG: S8 family serine peptidase [Hyphomicrobiales bacterium]|nr:S8 family serine peptidase [Hyphomicrobiales bacterium]